MDEKTKTAEAELYLAPPGATEETETVREQEDRATAPNDREPGEPDAFV